MERLETGKDKIKKICEILKNESLEPAKQESQKMIEEATQRADEILKETHEKCEKMIEEAKSKIEKEREIFQTTLRQASQQALIALKQTIENTLFNQQLAEWVDKSVQDPLIASVLIQTLVKAIEKEGTSADFSALIGEAVPKEKVNALLAKEILGKLREKSVEIGDFEGGIKLKLHDKKLLLDISDAALKELLGKYLRKDFREHLFKA